jgi:hypothetical protein
MIKSISLRFLTTTFLIGSSYAGLITSNEFGEMLKGDSRDVIRKLYNTPMLKSEDNVIRTIDAGEYFRVFNGFVDRVIKEADEQKDDALISLLSGLGCYKLDGTAYKTIIDMALYNRYMDKLVQTDKFKEMVEKARAKRIAQDNRKLQARKAETDGYYEENKEFVPGEELETFYKTETKKTKEEREHAYDQKIAKEKADKEKAREAKEKENLVNGFLEKIKDPEQPIEEFEKRSVKPKSIIFAEDLGEVISDGEESASSEVKSEANKSSIFDSSVKKLENRYNKNIKNARLNAKLRTKSSQESDKRQPSLTKSAIFTSKNLSSSFIDSPRKEQSQIVKNFNKFNDFDEKITYIKLLNDNDFKNLISTDDYSNIRKSLFSQGPVQFDDAVRERLRELIDKTKIESLKVFLPSVKLDVLKLLKENNKNKKLY